MTKQEKINEAKKLLQDPEVAEVFNELVEQATAGKKPVDNSTLTAAQEIGMRMLKQKEEMDKKLEQYDDVFIQMGLACAGDPRSMYRVSQSQRGFQRVLRNTYLG